MLLEASNTNNILIGPFEFSSELSYDRRTSELGVWAKDSLKHEIIIMHKTVTTLKDVLEIRAILMKDSKK